MLDQSLEPEPRVQVQVPKPEPHGEEEVTADYESPLNKLAKLDKNYLDKNIGFDGKGFRSTHAQSLNFFKYRKASTVGHPNARFDIDEEFSLRPIVICFSRSQLQENKFFTRRPLPKVVMIIV